MDRLKAVFSGVAAPIYTPLAAMFKGLTFVAGYLALATVPTLVGGAVGLVLGMLLVAGVSLTGGAAGLALAGAGLAGLVGGKMLGVSLFVDYEDDFINAVDSIPTTLFEGAAEKHPVIKHGSTAATVATVGAIAASVGVPFIA
tara:strand:- start:530 stop:958 length:429 start_codon:yes stop_codon:yes gene_type:complete